MNPIYVIGYRSTDLSHKKTQLVQHTTDPHAARDMGRPVGMGSGWRTTVYLDEEGAIRGACQVNYHLHRGRGYEYWLPIKVYMDGNMWCATHLDFINLQESPAGFGATIDAAVADLDRPLGDLG